jgi:Fe-S-cluster-containing dehydrogenase component/DMSO reductase anchor subunit
VVRLPVINVANMLGQQRSLTAVERFSQREHALQEADARLYRDLIPLERPKPGEQYSFEVDLDACTGCKACVAACHTLNGLDTNEVFRKTGLLRNSKPESAALKTVTSSCHHCLDPACLTGCPVAAYEKDPLTGIVKHLDDQCFGCQYCTLMCPYDAPQYNPERGIVRKCDMCSDRLAHGQAPACVEACPTSAIRVRNVAKDAVATRLADGFLPGVADPVQTQPSTHYVSRSRLEQFAPVDALRAEQQHAPASLVLLLTLTQLAAGTAALEPWALHGTHSLLSVSRISVALAAILGVVASLFHLGRPLLAYRAVLGLRTSWLSREALVLGLFAGLSAAAAAATLFEPWVGASTATVLALLSAACGLCGVFCSVMVYAATRRPHWALERTAARFFGGTFSLAASGSLAVLSLTVAGAASFRSSERGLLAIVLGIALARLTHSGLWGRAPASTDASAHARQLRALHGPLRAWGRARTLGVLAGGVLAAATPFAAPGGLARALLAVLSFGLLLASELCDRYLFFAAAPPSRMPGSMK